MALRPWDQGILSICTGIGGLDLGVVEALRYLGSRPRVLCCVERETRAAANLVARMADKTMAVAPIYDDLSTFPGDTFVGLVDLVVGGIPCQPHSQASKRRGSEDERDLWPQTLELAEAVGAHTLFIENVAGLITHTHEDQRFVQDLDDRGWDSVYDLYPAPLVGATQPRQRVFVLAYRRDHGLPQFGSPHNDHRRDEARNFADGCHQDFPPGPRDVGGWSRVVRDSSCPQPGLRREAVQFPGRVDRVRVLGNSCIPLQVAIAFLDLYDRVREKAENHG